MRRTHGLRCTGAAIIVAVAMTAVGCVGGAPPAGRPPSTDHPEPAPPADDPALVSRSIMPPGNGNISGFTTAHLDDQRAAYDRLEVAQATGTVTDESLPAYYKDARLDASAASVRTDTPTPGVSVRWDRWGVPTVHGDTAEQVAWGAGWVVAETRLLIAEAGRVLGRAGTIEMGGSDIIGALAQIGSLPQVNYTDAELEADVAACEAEWAKNTATAKAKPRTRDNSKQAEVIRMLQRPEGATIGQICTATGWQAHTVRGTFAGAFKKKLGLTIVSDKPQGGERIYRIA